MNEHRLASARVAAHFRQRWLRGYVQSKLRRDPVFQTAYELFRESERPILDVGCGLGLLGFYLRERGCQQPILGLDIDERKVREGSRIVQGEYLNIQLDCRDVREQIPEFSGDVVLFDLLHYLEPLQQDFLLSRLMECIPPAGALVIRDGLRERSARYRMTWIAEKFAQIVSWNLSTPLYFPSREQISGGLDEEKFSCEIQPLWGSTPFSNYLFVVRRKPQ